MSAFKTRYIPAARALALAAAVSLPALAFAQEAAPPPLPADQGDITAHAHPDGGWRGRMGDHGGRRVKALHDVLGIRPDQEGAFQAFAAAIRPARQGPEAPGAAPRPDPAALAAMTTPERLDYMAKRMDERQSRMRARFQRLSDATKTLYADLSPDQQRIMNALPELGHAGGGGRWDHRGGMDHLHGGPPPAPPSGE